MERIRSRMHAHPPTACLDVMLQGPQLLRICEHVPGCVEEDDRLVSSQISLSKQGCVFSRINGEVIGPAQRLDQGDAIRNRCMAKTCCRREHQHFERGRLGRGGAGRDHPQQQGALEDFHGLPSVQS